MLLGKESLQTTANTVMSSSNNSVNSDDTIFGAKSRPPARKRDKKKSKKTRSSDSPDSESENKTQSINSSESESEDESSNSEERFTTSHASYPPIDLTEIEMSDCHIDDEPPIEDLCDIK
jgi:hypothetical protein